MSRYATRQVACPVCHAPPGSQCVNKNGEARVANHRGRGSRSNVMAKAAARTRVPKAARPVSDNFDGFFDADGIDRKHFEVAWAEHVRRAKRNAIAEYGHLSLACESPAERQMLAALMLIYPWSGYMGFGGVFHEAATGWSLEPQAEIGPYRTDFLITIAASHPTELPIKAIVEVDGHDFHEKTKEQAARDKARDRYFTSQGYLIFRFTGSEVYRDAPRCAQEVSDALDDRVWERKKMALAIRELAKEPTL